MTANSLVTLGRGNGSALLQSVRLAVGQAEVYGAEEVAAYFRAHPVDLDGGAVVSSARHIAILGAEQALIADIYDGHVARLWLVGAAQAPAAETHVDVPFHLEMSQVPGERLIGRAEDHPFLSPEAWPSIEKAGLRLTSDLLREGGSVLSAHPVILRAFGDRQRACALVMLYLKLGGGARRLGFTQAAVLVEHGETSRVVRARDGADPDFRPWRPRIEA